VARMIYEHGYGCGYRARTCCSCVLHRNYILFRLVPLVRRV
jgi:hypothetical protein